MVSARFDADLQVKRPLKSFDTFGLAICLGTLRILLAEENVIRVEIIESLYLFDNVAGLRFGFRHERLLTGIWISMKLGTCKRPIKATII